MSGLGRFLILAGIALVAIGVLVTWGPRVPFLSQLGKLPGDLRFERQGVRVFFPITTSILVSIVLTILLRLFVKR